MISILWFKKDLRIYDHEPLFQAAQSGPVLPLYVYEPDIIKADDYDPRHHAFINDSLVSLSQQLKQHGGQLHIAHGNVIDILRRLCESIPGIKAIYSHQETGNWISYQRDLSLKQWCNQNNIAWFECTNNGIQRPNKGRDGWAAEWNKRMNESTYNVPNAIQFVNLTKSGKIISHNDIGKDVTHERIQAGGRDVGLKTLTDFLTTRGERYSKEMSSPVTALTSCSRISPYLTYGCLSIREVYQQAKKCRSERYETGYKGPWLSSLSAFLGRLRWHCHFIQKLEDQPSIEWKNMSRSYDGIRENDFNNDFFEAWKTAQQVIP